jgi:hypothetical protein
VWRRTIAGAPPPSAIQSMAPDTSMATFSTSTTPAHAQAAASTCREGGGQIRQEASKEER